ncbi:hypothetical protein V9T40_012239 [Parthenolecanium corni]|uniref:Ig-like domain-containing protein n=1 Tax=Parthenolecanium corni TaxID=536013 RepID=A0AAN9T6Y9_9HEMI
MMFRLLVSAVICLNCLSRAEQKPEIVEITNNQALKVGESAELSCSVRNSRDYPVMWLKMNRGRFDNDPLYLSSDSTILSKDSRLSLKNNTSSSTDTYTLKISNIQTSDAGIYECVIFLSMINYIYKKVELDVYSLPVIHDNSSSTIVVKELNPVTMECFTGGTPEPLTWWKREDNAILPTGGTVYRGNVLKINSVKQEYGGTYLCTADNGVGEAAKRRITLKVEVPPNVQ